MSTYILMKIKEQNVLDLGRGTGALTLRAAEIGTKVKAIDFNPQMLENHF